MKLLFVILCLLIIVQLVYPFATILLSRLLGKTVRKATAAKEFDYACIITAYRNGSIALPLVESLLRQEYPRLHIYLVADECNGAVPEISDPRCDVLLPETPLRLKAKSIIYAVERFKRAHDYIVVFDADNLAHPLFLREINRYANAGKTCIQGRRTAKNLDSTYAALDSLGEHYKNYIEREVPCLLGGSSVISGSGMATETALYKAYLLSPEIEQGKRLWKKMLQEDKILQNFILRQRGKIAYAREAVVYDEKVESGAAVETQRGRWLFSYFQNIPNSGGLLLRGLFFLNWNQFYFGFVTLALPMFIQLGVAMLLAVAGLFIAPFWSVMLVLAMGVFAMGVLWALWLDGAPAPVWKAVWQVPRFVLRQIAGLAGMRDPNKNFKHTEHSKHVSVDDLLKK